DWREFFSVTWPAPTGLPVALSSEPIFQAKEDVTPSGANSTSQSHDLPGWHDQSSDATLLISSDGGHGVEHNLGNGHNFSLSDDQPATAVADGSSPDPFVDNSAPGSSASDLGSLLPSTHREQDVSSRGGSGEITYNESDRGWSDDGGT